MSTITNIRRIIAILNITKLRKINDFINKTKSIVQDIGNNATIFVTPVPTLSSVTGHITALETAQTNVASKVPDAVNARKPKYDAVMTDMRALLMYVQGLADAAATPDLAVSIITTAGFDVKNTGSFNKPTLTAIFNSDTGKVTLRAKAIGIRASYNWQYSTDGGTTWIAMPSTLQAKTTIGGLILSNKLVFCVMPVTKDGENIWSDPVSIH